MLERDPRATRVYGTFSISTIEPLIQSLTLNDVSTSKNIYYIKQEAGKHSRVQYCILLENIAAAIIVFDSSFFFLSREFTNKFGIGYPFRRPIRRTLWNSREYEARGARTRVARIYARPRG